MPKADFFPLNVKGTGTGAGTIYSVESYSPMSVQFGKRADGGNAAGTYQLEATIDDVVWFNVGSAVASPAVAVVQIADTVYRRLRVNTTVAPGTATDVPVVTVGGRNLRTS
jgi:hypothetical protein